MSVRATFIADFTSFNQAVDKAEVSLKDFSSGIARVDKDLAKFGNQFSGTKIIQEATLVAKAVENIGGASRLTASEQQRVNATVTEALAKFKALGQEAPRHLVELQKATRQADTEGSKLGGTFETISAKVKAIGPQLLAAFSVGAIVGFAKEVGAFAGRMQDLSAETRIGVERLQALNYVAAGAGLTIENITDAVNQMSNRIGSGDQSAVRALDRLGLSVYELQKLAPDEVFIEIGKAAAGVQDPMERTRTLMDLYGKSGARMGRLFTEDFDQVVKAAETSGAVLDKELIAKADAFDDAWTQSLLHVKAGIVRLVADLAGSGPKLEGSVKERADRILREERAALLPRAPGLPTGGGISAIVPKPEDIAMLTAQGDALLKTASARLKAAEAATRAAEAERKWRDETAEASNALAWMFAKLQPLPRAIENANASTTTLGGSMGNLSGLMLAVPWTKFAQNTTAAVEQATKATGGFFAGVTKGFHDLVAGMTGGNGLQGFLLHLGKGLIDGFGSILSGGISTLINKGVEVAWAGIKKIGRLIGDFIGGGEHARVNDMRDKFLEQFGGGGTGEGSGFFELAKKLTEITGQAGGGGLFAALTGAKTVDDFEKAVRAITDLLDKFKEAAETTDAASGVEAINDQGESIGELATISEETINKLRIAMNEASGDMRAFAATLRDPVIAAINETIAAIDRIPRHIEVAVSYRGGSPSSPLVTAPGTPVSPSLFPPEPSGGGGATAGDVAAAADRAAADAVDRLSVKMDLFRSALPRELTAAMGIVRGRGASFAT